MNDEPEENPYAFQEPPKQEPAKHQGPIKVTRTSAQEKAKRERMKQARKVRRARSIARSGILFFSLLYFGVAFLALMAGTLLAGLEGSIWGLIIACIPILMGLVYIGLLFWAKKKTVAATLTALGLALIPIIGLFVLGGKSGVVYLLVAFGYCVYGLTLFRRERKKYNALAAEHVRRGLK